MSDENSVSELSGVDIRPSTERPGGYLLTAETLLAETPEQLFSFFGDAFQLERLTPPWLRFSVTTPRPIDMGEGTLIDYRLRLHGIPMRWRSKITAWSPPFRFVDEQVRGPYKYWIHEHSFTAEEDGTRVRDCVEYGVPLGRILHPLLVRRDLCQVFAYRATTLCDLFTPVESPRK